LRQTRLAVARYKHVDKRRERFGVLRAGAAGDDQRMVHRPLVRPQGNTAQIEHRQQIGVADLVLQRKAEHVEFGQWRKGLQTVQRQTGFAEPVFHVRPGRKDAFAVPVVAGVHQRVQYLQTVMAHPDRVRIRKGQAQPAPNGAGVFANHVPFAADVLGRHFHSHQDAIDQMLLQIRLVHGRLSGFRNESSWCDSRPSWIRKHVAESARLRALTVVVGPRCQVSCDSMG